MTTLRDDIIALATERMRAVGIRSVSVDDICHALGISKKTFYVHFETKDALVDCLLRRNELSLKDEFQKAVDQKSVVQCIVEAAKLAKMTSQSSHTTAPVMHDLKKYYPALHATHERKTREIIEDFLRQFLQKGIEENIFRKEIDPKLTAALFVDVNRAVVHAQLSEQRAIGKNHLDILLRGIFTVEGLATLEQLIHE